MWWEIAPGAVIIMVALSVPQWIRPTLGNLINGRPYTRPVNSIRNTEYTMRDERLTGDAYKPLGLDDIPDEPRKS